MATETEADEARRYAQGFLELPRAERQIIRVLGAEKTLEATLATYLFPSRKEQHHIVVGARLVTRTPPVTRNPRLFDYPWKDAGKAIASFSFGAAGATASLIFKRQKDDGLLGRQIYSKVAEHMPFHPGSLKPDAVYVCHPHKDLYYLAAEADHHIFEDRLHETAEVFEVLGAERIDVTGSETVGNSLNAVFKALLPDGGGGGFKTSRTKKGELLIREELPGAKFPALNPITDPERFCWYQHDSTLQGVHRARVDSGITSKTVSIVTSHEATFSAELAVKAKAAGLEIGGGYSKELEASTAWTVKFPAQ